MLAMIFLTIGWLVVLLVFASAAAGWLPFSPAIDAVIAVCVMIVWAYGLAKLIRLADYVSDRMDRRQARRMRQKRWSEPHDGNER